MEYMNLHNRTINSFKKIQNQFVVHFSDGESIAIHIKDGEISVRTLLPKSIGIVLEYYNLSNRTIHSFKKMHGQIYMELVDGLITIIHIKDTELSIKVA